MRRFASLALAAALLSGCGTLHRLTSSDPGSYVAGIGQADTPAVTGTVANFLALRAVPRDEPLALAPPAHDPVLTPALATALRRAGYTVAAPGQGRHTLTYQVEPMRGGVLVRLILDDTRGARFLARAKGGALEPVGAFTVMEAQR